MLNVAYAVVLDFIIGDPYNFPHPIRLMGKLISLEESVARKWCKTNKSLKVSGLIIVLVNVIIGFLFPLLLLRLFKDNKVVYTIINTYLIYTCISARCL